MRLIVHQLLNTDIDMQLKFQKGVQEVNLEYQTKKKTTPSSSK